MKRYLLSALAAVVLSACSVPAVKYEAKYDNVKVIKQIEAEPVVIGETKARSSDLENVGMRADTIVSPHGETLVDYIAFALKSELNRAGIYKDGASKVINFTVTENEIDEEGFSKATTIISVEFTITKGDEVLFKKTLMSRYSWDSSFVAAVALPRALNSYPATVSDLLQKLYSDKEFQKALQA